MSDIPADIRETAKTISGRFSRTGYYNAALASDIAMALMAERECCAKIAEDLADLAESQNAKFEMNSLDFQRWAEGCRNVAAAIRPPVA